MSYINEALKKAQRDKDARRIRYLRDVKTTWKHKTGLPPKIIGGIVSLLILLGLGFALYLWLYKPFAQSHEAPEGKLVQGGISDPDKGINQIAAQNGPTDQNTIDPAPLLETAISPNTARLYDRAKGLYKRGRFQDSEKAYKNVLRLNPEFPDALNDLGVLYIRTRNFDEAKECFEKVIQMEPGSVEPYYNLACLHSIKGEVREGLAQLNQAFKLNPSVKEWAEEDPDLLNLRGVPDYKDVIKD